MAPGKRRNFGNPVAVGNSGKRSEVEGGKPGRRYELGRSQGKEK